MPEYRYGGENYYYWYRWDVQEIPGIGIILKNIQRIDKFTQEREEIGSCFMQFKRIEKRGHYLVYCPVHWMVNEPRVVQ